MVSGFLTSPWLHVTDVVRGGQADPKLVEEVDVEHVAASFVSSESAVRVRGLRARTPCWPASGRAPQTSSTQLGSRRDRSMPSSSAARKTSSSASRISIAVPSLGQHLDVEAERLHLLDEHLERLGDAGVGDVLALDDGLVDLHAAGHVVGLDREQLLQGVGGAVGLHRPDLHLAEALATELGLTAQRLLRDHRVGAGAARVDLVVDEVVQLEDVHVADRDRLRERLAGAAVEERAPCRRRRSAARRRGWVASSRAGR